MPDDRTRVSLDLPVDPSGLVEPVRTHPRLLDLAPEEGLSTTSSTKLST